MSTDTNSSVLSQNIVRNLSDKLYDKRKIGATEIENLVKSLNATRDEQGLRNVLQVLNAQFIVSVQPNVRKGGLLAIAAFCVALLQDTVPYLDEIVPGVLKCFSDHDHKVRFHACESMYNIAKVARGAILVYFDGIFDGLCRLSADLDVSVKNAAQILDRLLKDIVTETENFDVEKFIPLIKDRVSASNPNVRQFVLGWIEVLSAVPDIFLLEYLPSFLDGLFHCLSMGGISITLSTNSTSAVTSAATVTTAGAANTTTSPNATANATANGNASATTAPAGSGSPSAAAAAANTPQAADGTNVAASMPTSTSAAVPAALLIDVRTQAARVLNDFLEEIKQAPQVDYGALVPIVIFHCQSTDWFTTERALVWSHVFLEHGREQLLPWYSDLLGVVLPCISHSQESIRVAASRTNEELRRLVQHTKHEIEFSRLIRVIQIELVKYSVATRIAALHWLYMLLNKNFAKVMDYVSELFTLLLKILSDPSEEVVSLDLEVLAVISSKRENFSKFMTNLVAMFSTDHKLLSKADLIIRQLCMKLGSERIYREFSRILEREEDLEFASLMIQTINMILLTNTELTDLRDAIKRSVIPAAANQSSSSTSEASGTGNGNGNSSTLSANEEPSRGRSRSSSATEGTHDLFVTLYRSWCHNPIATLSLCLLAQAYEHASDLIKHFAEIEVSVSFLVQIDKLVQLIESPIFAYLRLQLLEPYKYSHLLTTLYGLLMLLPQSSAYDTLKSRLKCVSSLTLLHLISQRGANQLLTENLSAAEAEASKPTTAAIPFDKLLAHFVEVQRKHKNRK